MSRRDTDWRTLREMCDHRMPESLARLLLRHNVSPAEYQDLERWCGEAAFERISEVVKLAVQYDHHAAEWTATR